MKQLLAMALLAGIAGCASPGVQAEFTPSAQQRFVPAGSALELLWNDGDFTEGPALAPRPPRPDHLPQAVPGLLNG